MNFTRMFNPKSLAVIGGDWADEVVRQSLLAGYKGKIYPINPKRDAMQNIACLASIADLPEAPDAAFVVVQHEKAIEAIEQLAKLGCGGAVIFAAGFAEEGEKGVDRQNRLVAAAGDMPIIGPNCYGLINMRSLSILWPDFHGLVPVDKGIGLITQSGNMAFNFTMHCRNLPIAMTVALGNQAQVNLAIMMKAMADDDAITGIGIHAETLGDAKEFAKSVQYARSKGKECILLKTGISEHGALLAQSHTASMAGGGKATIGFCTRLGVPLAQDVPEFLDALSFIHNFGGLLDNQSVVSFSCSGGEAALMADCASRISVNFPAFNEESKRNLFQVHGEKVYLNNPFDYHTYIWGDKENLYKNFLYALQSDFSVGILILDFPNRQGMHPQKWYDALDSFSEAILLTKRRGIVLSSMAETMPSLAITKKYPHLLFMSGIENCVRVIKICTKKSANYEIINRKIANHATQLLETPKIREILQKYDIKFPQSVIITDVNAPIPSFPVVVKAEGLAHKTESGGVILNINNHAEFTKAFNHCKKLSAHILVEQMMMRPICELLMGIVHDNSYGLMLMIGEGGILTEIRQDSSLLFLPASREDCMNSLKELKIFPILQGYRKQKLANLDKICDMMMNLAQFAMDYQGKICSLDLNPVLIYENDCVAVDTACEFFL